MIWRYPNFRKHPSGERQQKHKTAPWFLPGRWRFWVGAPWFTAQHGWGARPPSQSVSGFSSILKTLRPWIRDTLSPIIEVENDPPLKWKERIILEIHPFSTVPWLWEEGILSLRTNKHQGHLKKWRVGRDEGKTCFQGQKENLEIQGANLLLVSGSVLVMVKRNPLNRVEPFSES